jgi:hypothetical protein
VTKKDLDVICEALSETRPPIREVTAREQWELIVRTLADMLPRVNERFDRNRFFVECGKRNGEDQS